MITVYSKNNCPYCIHAKQYLESKNINYREVNIEQDPEARKFIMEQGHRTVPQIYVGKEIFVQGGWQGLQEMSQEDIINRLSDFNNPLGTL
jgi:glutaredoxin